MSLFLPANVKPLAPAADVSSWNDQSTAALENAELFKMPKPPLPPPSPPPSWRQNNNPKSKNIKHILLYTFFAFSSRSLWNQSVLSAFVYLLKSNDPKYVGLITCAMGIAQLLSSLPAGILADVTRRDVVIRLSAGVGIIAAVFTIVASHYEQFTFLTVALSAWGIFWGLSNTSIVALFADSITDGERSYYFTLRMALTSLGNATGPMVAWIMFSFLGNDWTVEECKFVLGAGQVLSLPALIMLFFMNDDYIVKNDNQNEHETGNGTDTDTDDTETNGIENTLGNTTTSIYPHAEIFHDDEHLSLSSTELEVNTNTNTNTNTNENENGLNSNSNNGFVCQETFQDNGLLSLTSNDLETPLLSESSNSFSPSSSPLSPSSWSPSPSPSTTSSSTSSSSSSSSRIVPILVISADIMSGLASGMSIRYFPIFFLENLQLTPRTVQAVFLCTTITMAGMGLLTQKIGSKLGRLQTTILFRYTGALLFVSMVAFYQYHGDAHPFLVCVLFVLRSATMNSTSALTRSVLMDAVPKGERAKWSAMESVNMFGWAGSAALGGYLVDWKGIEFNFYLTAALQFVSTTPFWFILGKVSRKE